MTGEREFPSRPVVGVGGVVIRDGRALIVRRGTEPLKGEWSIPGGALELGENLEQAVRRERLEETGLQVSVIELLEVYERIIAAAGAGRPRYHFVILDYLCSAGGEESRPGSDAAELAWISEARIPEYGLSPAAASVLSKAFLRAREQHPAGAG